MRIYAEIHADNVDLRWYIYLEIRVEDQLHMHLWSCIPSSYHIAAWSCEV